jgi:Raf kinase inhibitor-like YbhB/YbcL family protein
VLHHVPQLRTFTLAIALGAFACSSDDSAAPMTSAGATGGQGGAGGSSNSTTATGGSTGVGTTSTTASGSSGAGGASGGSSGAGGSSGGASGSGGSGALDASSNDGAGGSAPADGGPRDTGSPDGASDASTQFSLTSSAFMAGGTFPAANTCASGTTGNNSPALAWSPGPSTTRGYAIVLWDRTNMFRHWVIWDIPPETMSLAASLPKTAQLTMPAGARQISFQGAGYAGPCPPGTEIHTYEFDLYAVNVLPLPGATNNPGAAEAAVMARQVAKATLMGQGASR